MQSNLTVYALGSGLGSPRYLSEKADAGEESGFQLIHVLSQNLILITRLECNSYLLLWLF